MAEANLVKGDLLEILAKISPTAMDSAWKHKIAVATCTFKHTRIRTLADATTSGTPRAVDMAV
jgi:hypothetical protein